MTRDSNKSLARVLVSVMFVSALGACASDSPPSGQAASPATVCNDYENPSGNVRGDRSLEENRNHLVERVSVFAAVADLLEARHKTNLGQGARTIAAALQAAANAKDNPSLLKQLATLTTDARLVAIANDLDQAVGTICGSPSTTAISTHGS